jgi:hypothetical protein
MGLDARVRCRCWEDGEATPFAFPDLVEVDAEGYLGLSVPWKKNEESHRAFRAWLKSCCPHPGGWRITEWIGNWYGVSEFRHALRAAGEVQFARLIAELPTANGGQTSPTQARRCIAELDEFMQAPPFGRRIWIVDTQTGAHLHNPMPHGGWFTSRPERPLSKFERLLARFGVRRVSAIRLGVDEEGIFVEKEDKNGAVTKLLHSLSIEQIERGNGAIELRDLATSKTIIVQDGVKGILRGGGEISRYPRLVHVEVQADSAGEYRELAARLRTVLGAAVETGNPVLWC